MNEDWLAVLVGLCLIGLVVLGVVTKVFFFTRYLAGWVRAGPEAAGSDVRLGRDLRRIGCHCSRRRRAGQERAPGVWGWRRR